MSEHDPDLEAWLAAAVEIEDAADRERYVQRVCGENQADLVELQSMIRDYFAAGELLDRPAAVLPTTEAQDSAPLGSAVGPYRLREVLGEGGMGSVYVAEQEQPIRRKVALKIIKPGMDSREVISRFEAERQALALMDHPHIAKVLDAGTTDGGRPYFVMELVKGTPITEHCDRHKLAMRQRLELFQQVCQAVQHAHQKGIIHRDLKPSNVLVAMHDTTPAVKVIDFGVAKALGQQLTGHALYTGFSQLIGTPLYMSPEQAGQSSLDIDTRSDVYSLGIMLYELLTGSTPFAGETLQKAGIDELRRIIREVEPPRPSARVSTLQLEPLTLVSERRQVEPLQLCRSLRGELDWIVMKAIDKDRQRRYETANGLAMDIERYLHDKPIEACPPTRAYLMAKFARRNRLLLTSVGCIAASLLAAAAISLWQANEARRARQLADERLQQEHAARQVVLERESRLRRQLYASDVAGAWNAWSGGDSDRALDLLHGHDPVPEAPGDDLREFTWHYLAARSGRSLLTWRNHDAPLLAATVAPNNSFVASSDRSGRVCIYDLAAGRLVASWRYSDKEVGALAFSPDGTNLATAGQDATVRLWHVGHWNELACLREHQRNVTSVAWSPDGSRLASAARDGRVIVWDVAAQRPIQRLTDTTDVVHCVAWSPDGSLLAAADGPALRLWSTHDWTPCASITNLPRSLLAMAFSPDGKWLACGGYDRIVLVCDVASKTEVLRADATGSVWSLTFSPDSACVLAGVDDGGPNIWRMHPYEPRLEFVRVAFEHGGIQRAVVFARDGQVLLTAIEETSQVRLWDYRDQLGYRSVPFPDDCLLVLPRRHWAVTAAPNGAITLRDDSSAADVATLQGHSDRVSCAATDTSEQWLATAAANRELFVWELNSGKLLRRLPVTTPSIDELAFVPNQATLAVGSESHGIQLWDVTSGQQQREFRPESGGVHAIAFSGDGTVLAASSSQLPAAYLWDVNQGTLTTTLSADQLLYRLRFTPDDRQLLVGGRTNGILVWDLATGQEIRRLLGHRGGVMDIAISPDVQTLATLGADRTVRLWHLPTGRELATVMQHYTSHWVRFTSDRTLLVGVELGPQHERGVCVFGAQDDVP